MSKKSALGERVTFPSPYLDKFIPSFSGHRLEAQVEQTAERFNEIVLENKNEESPSFTE